MPPRSSLVFRAGYETFVDLLHTARETVRIVVPGIDEPRAQVLIEAKKRAVDVRVVVDPAEETERHGYGTLRAVDQLRDAGIDVRQLPGNAVGFVLADGEGYLLFPQSRMFVEEGEGINAVRVDAILADRLTHVFFPSHTTRDERAAAERKARALVELERLVHAETPADEPVPEVASLDTEAFDEAKEAIRRHPPKDPILTRQFSAYTTKLQFLEVTLKGGTFDDRMVSLPDSVPLGVSEELRDRLRTRMRIFDRNEFPALQRFHAFKKEVDAFRDEHSTYLPSRKKRIFRTEHKQQIIEELARLQSEIEPLVQAMATDVVEAIIQTERELIEEISRLLQEHPPDKYDIFLSNPSTLASVAHREAEQIVARISFPEPRDVLDRIELRAHFYDMTWQDFDDEAFIRELHDLEVIDTESAYELHDLLSAFEASSK